MDPMIFTLILLLVLIALKIPIAFSLAITGLLYLYIDPGTLTLASLQDQAVTGIHEYSFLAVPFFILAGRVFNNAGVTERIFDFSLSLVGHIKGGLGHVNIIASMIFSGMSGAAVADAAGLGLIEIKAMKDAGYPSSLAACITAASATIGPIIPPSVTLVLFGALAHVSIGRLFLGGVIPGLLMGLFLMIATYIMAFRAERRGEEWAVPEKNIRPKEVWRTFKRAVLPAAAPIIILGSIVLGIVTPTEAGVVAILYAFVLGFIYRNIDIRETYDILVETGKQVGAVMLILAGARVFSYVMTINRVPDRLTQLAIGFTEEAWILLLIINITLIILGMFINSSTILILTIPILVPLLVQYGVNVVHFGVVMTLNVMIGMITPPLGVTLYISADIADIEFEETLKDIIPFYIPLVITLLLITYIPDLVLWLPEVLM